MFSCQHGKSALSSDEYRRLHGAFLAMAQQSDLPNAQARWLAGGSLFQSRNGPTR